MTIDEKIQLLFTTIFSIGAIVVIVELVLIGAPPRHCQYMVGLSAC